MNEIELTTEQCRRLWCAVISQAIVDIKTAERAMSKTLADSERSYHRLRKIRHGANALGWIASKNTQYSNSFESLCNDYGFDPQAVREAIL